MCAGSEISFFKDGSRLLLDDSLEMKCTGLVTAYVRVLKQLINTMFNEFFHIAVAALSSKKMQYEAAARGRRVRLDFDREALQLATSVPDSRRECPGFLFFGGHDAVSRRSGLMDLVKKLVEYEGHRL